jgi:hypothetical protein
VPIAAGNIIYASDLLMTSSANADSTSRTTTSTSYTTTLSPANICGTSFVAPPSGKVSIEFSSAVSNSGANTTLCAPGIQEGSTVGSGASFQAADDARSIWVNGTSGPRIGASMLVTGLTAGSVYNVALFQRVTAGTGTYQAREVTVYPQLA